MNERVGRTGADKALDLIPVLATRLAPLQDPFYDREAHCVAHWQQLTR